MGKRVMAFLVFALLGFSVCSPVGNAEPNQRIKLDTPKEFLSKLVAPEDYKILNKIASCESSWNTNAYNKTTNDIGIFQIHLESHQKKAEELSYNLFDWRDNIRYAILLYREGGVSPWFSSRKCWRNS